jgi:hypothetical protein
VAISRSTTSADFSMTLSFPSAVIIGLCAAFVGVVALTPAPAAVRVPLGVPLVLFLPGFVLSMALAPSRMSWAERLAQSIGISVAVCVVGGFALHLSGLGLRTESWIPLLFAVTIAGALVARRRGRLGDEGLGHLLARVRPRLSLRTALAVVPALVLVGLAVALARTPLPARGVAGYTTLWLLPANPAPDAVQIGVSSAERGSAKYRLELRASGQVALVRRLTLETGEQWKVVVDVSSFPLEQRSFEALLYKADNPHSAYRRVTLVLPGSTLPPATGMWLVAGRPGTNTVRLSVASAEVQKTSFRVELRGGASLERVQRFTLDPGGQWNAILDLGSIPQTGRVLQARLYKKGSPREGAPYRRARLTLAG